MSTSVTIAIPIYKRLEYLPGVLRTLQAQTHDNLDILISDNGLIGPKLEEIVDQHLTRPYRLRRNPEIVGITDHFNQLAREAAGEYFVLLSDDDEISPNYVSSLASALDSDPDIGVALGKLDVIDEHGTVVPRKNGGMDLPPIMSGREFVHAWCHSVYNFVCFATNMARTADIKRVGGYPESLPMGTSIDNALLLKLCGDRRIALAFDATFRYRVYEASHGLALPYRELARDLKAFLRFLDKDPVLQSFGNADRASWSAMKSDLREMTWRTYRHRWKGMYRNRLSAIDWVRAAFAMPFITPYYWSVIVTIFRRGARAAKHRLYSWKSILEQGE